MFTRKTVFIFGAGVSAQFGFPAGSEIVNYIAQGAGTLWKTDGTAVSSVHADTQLVISLGKAVAAAQPRSIDAFLEHRPDLQGIGKIVLAQYVGSHETEARIWVPDNCIRLILDKMADRCAPDDICKNQVSFITFNYDRSLEHFLHSALKARYGLQDRTAAEWLRHIPIVHVYGQLGYLPWQKEILSIDGPQQPLYDEKIGIRPYEAGMRPEMVQLAANGIEIISSAHPESTAFQYARSLINNAQMVIALGFGYHPENMERLNLKRSSARSDKGQIICGSWNGMTNAEKRMISNRYHIAFPTDSFRAYDFLRNFDDFVGI